LLFIYFEIIKKKLGYMACSSLRPSHTKSLALDAFRSLDTLVLTGLSTIPEGEVRDEIDKV
jgi:hypothetical protein